jgi:glycosyltransferase involved in cell wall biosynthesis
MRVVLLTEAFLGPHGNFQTQSGKLIGGAEIYLDYLTRCVLEKRFQEVYVVQKGELDVSLSPVTRVLDFQKAGPILRECDLLILNGTWSIPTFEFFPRARKTVLIHHGMIMPPPWWERAALRRVPTEPVSHLQNLITAFKLMYLDAMNRWATVRKLNTYAQRADLTVSVDRFSLRYVRREGRNRWRVVNSFFDRSLFHEGVRALPELQLGRLNILVPRNLSYGRGVFILPDLVKRLRAWGLDQFTFLVAGTGSLYEFLREKIEANHCQEYLRLLGHQDHSRMPGLLASSEIVLVPSLCNEGVPIAVLEAMGMKKPVVTTNVGGINDVGTHAVHKMASRFNPEKIARHLYTLATDEGCRKAMGENAYRYVSAHYDLGRWIEQWGQIITDALAGGGGAPPPQAGLI